MKYCNRKLMFFQAVMFVFVLLTVSFAAEVSINVNGQQRRMEVHIPSNLPSNSPLVISLHGMNQDPPYQSNQTKWESAADTAKFIVVYPWGNSLRWDISGNSDIDFIVEIINYFHINHNIDRNRVYLTGFSMGGMMTYHAATRIADRIAAFAPVSGYIRGNPNTNSSRPIPLIHVHGTGDDVVPYGSDGSFIGIENFVAGWAARNGCSSTPQITNPYPANRPNSNGRLYHWGQGLNNVEVALLRLERVGHWHSNDANGVMSTHEIWNFIKRFSLTGSTTVTPDTVIIPGRIEAEKYSSMSGIQVEPDAQGNDNVGWINDGDWTKYLVNVTETAIYSLQIRVATGVDVNNRIVVKNQSGETLGTLTVDASKTNGWHDWYTDSITVELQQGEQELTFEFTGESDYLFNIDWFEFSLFTTSIFQRKELSKTGYHVRVRPNPLGNNLTLFIQAPLGEEVKYEIYNLKGRKVFSGIAEANSQTIIINKNIFGSGMYFISLISGHKTKTATSVLLID